MPTPSRKLVQSMREDGFIPTAEAVALSHHALSTIYEWIATERLPGRRAGLFHFVDRAALERLCPQVKVKAAAEGAR